MLNCGLGLILLLGLPIYFLFKTDSVLALLTTFHLSEMQLAFVAALAISAVTGTCYFTAPSVSLEGKTLWILRTCPIDSKFIIQAKLKMHLILTAPLALIASGILSYALQCSLTGIIIVVLLPQLFILLNAALGLILNLIFPNFEWTNEAIPVKQSLPVTLIMLTMTLLPILLIVGCFYLDIAAKIYVLLSIALVTAADLFCLLWLDKNAAARFDRL